MTERFFELAERAAHKGAPRLIGGDERAFARIAATLAAEVDRTRRALDEARRVRASWGQAAVQRDAEVRRLEAHLRVLRRVRADLALGRMDVAGIGSRTWIGRIGLADEDGERVLVDWRTPAATAFFAATPATPLGLARRRRYRWAHGRVIDYWDEALDPGVDADDLVLEADSAFLRSLGEHRSGRMRDVLATIQADQDAIVRADAHGALVVDGGPGTGKTVVALHRAAYLLAAEERIREGGLLFVGPHEPYLAYVADVLPGLGEEGVVTCTLRDLVPEGAGAQPETDRAVAALKASPRMLDAVRRAVAAWERPPEEPLEVGTPWGGAVADAAAWAEAFAAADPASTHDDARDEVWAALLEVLAEQIDEEEARPEAVRRALARDEALRSAFGRAWPVLDPAGLVADLWSHPALLRRCAPWLAEDDVLRLQRTDPRAWTESDLAILDAMRALTGEPEAVRQRRRREAAVAAERAGRNRVVDELIAGDDGEGLVALLRGADAQRSLLDEAALPAPTPDALRGPFAHVVVDEAQELTPMQWAAVLRRCPSGSLTVVGDRAQARAGFAESWEERLRTVGVRSVRRRTLGVNYRTPEEVMAEAEPVIRAALPDAAVPVAVRTSGVPVHHGSPDELAAVLTAWLEREQEGVACVIGAPSPVADPRVRALDPVAAKGLEFDLVVLVDPAGFGGGVRGAVDRYVAMTRATERLVVLGR
ncbi:RNA polymerase recycling motor ATPase HelR [Amnibacterium setariae]|uniref:AAA family ATPase n=1 Tax=Amnibacterium setariae TaxID=2306585 RepID=A0A3A1TX07_9MICO|nr:RNA polymerase recycling motor ATPase HelR [Amnibacterium setariae]RIX28138.1 AAA family ATPase [Amnibacterium setariae]